MSNDAPTNRCTSSTCIYNTSGQCRHALRPDPQGCPHRRAVSNLATDRVVMFLRRKSEDAQVSLSPEPVTV